MNAFIDMLLALFTLSQALTFIAAESAVSVLRVLSIVLAVIIVLYCVFAAVTMLIFGILGARGKRSAAFDKFMKQFGGDALDEHEDDITEEQQE